MQYKGIWYNEYRILSEYRIKNPVPNVDYSIVRSRYEVSTGETKYSVTMGHYLIEGTNNAFQLDDKKVFITLDPEGFSKSSSKGINYTSFIVPTEVALKDFKNKHLYYAILEVNTEFNGLNARTWMDIPIIGYNPVDAMRNFMDQNKMSITFGDSPRIRSAESESCTHPR